MLNRKGVFILLIIVSLQFNIYSEKLKIGTTLQPYYSWVKNIVLDRAEVIPLIKSGNNVHNYSPRPADIERAMGLDVLVVNGVGHDQFAFKILEATALDRDKLPLIYANEGVALMPVGGASGKAQINSHTFVSISVSIQQIYNIAGKLGEIDKKNAQFYRANASKYAQRLRKIKTGFMRQLVGVGDINLRCATIHGGYDYLLQEFGIQIVAVVEPSHGVTPTASQMAETIEKLKKLNVNIVFTEMNFGPKYIGVIAKETGAEVKKLSHLTSGDYTANNFEDGMTKNMQVVVDAILGK